MKKGWIVKLTNSPNRRLKMIYGANYFPRRFHYKKDALECLRHVRAHEGDGVIEKEA